MVPRMHEHGARFEVDSSRPGFAFSGDLFAYGLWIPGPVSPSRITPGTPASCPGRSNTSDAWRRSKLPMSKAVVRNLISFQPLARYRLKTPAKTEGGPRPSYILLISIQSGSKSGSSSAARFILLGFPILNAFSSQCLACSNRPNWHS